MDTKASPVHADVDNARPERPPLREEMRAGRGLLVGLALSSIFWLGLLVVWLAL